MAGVDIGGTRHGDRHGYGEGLAQSGRRMRRELQVERRTVRTGLDHDATVVAELDQLLGKGGIVGTVLGIVGGQIAEVDLRVQGRGLLGLLAERYAYGGVVDAVDELHVVVGLTGLNILQTDGGLRGILRLDIGRVVDRHVDHDVVGTADRGSEQQGAQSGYYIVHFHRF